MYDAKADLVNLIVKLRIFVTFDAWSKPNGIFYRVFNLSKIIQSVVWYDSYSYTTHSEKKEKYM